MNKAKKIAYCIHDQVSVPGNRTKLEGQVLFYLEVEEETDCSQCLLGNL